MSRNRRGYRRDFAHKFVHFTEAIVTEAPAATALTPQAVGLLCRVLPPRSKKNPRRTSIYFGLAKLDLVLSAAHLSSIPISAAPGFALATVLLRGLRIWPAVFVGALAAGAPAVITDVSLAEVILISSMAVGNALAAVIAGYLINVWADGRR